MTEKTITGLAWAEESTAPRSFDFSQARTLFIAGCAPVGEERAFWRKAVPLDQEEVQAGS